MKIHIVCTYVVCRVIWVKNKLLAGRKCDISVCTADIFKLAGKVCSATAGLSYYI